MDEDSCVMIVTSRRLRQLDVCESYLRRLQRKFGAGPVHVTKEFCIIHHNDEAFNWVWAGQHLLSSHSARMTFACEHARAMKEYRIQRDIVWTNYMVARTLAWNDFIENGEVWKLYIDALDLSYREYHDAELKALAEYNYKCAVSFGTLAEETE